MSTKKKLSKPAGPQPLLKLKFEKFPDRQVAVYFEKEKRCFYADFGFEQYESPSVAGLEQKIKAAIKKGATPDVKWIPVIDIEDEGSLDSKPTPDGIDGSLIVQVNRRYVALGRSGVCEAPWGSSEKGRNTTRESNVFGYSRRGIKQLPPLPWHSPDKWDHHAVLPYSEALWQQLTSFVHQLRTTRAALHTSFQSGDFTKLLSKAAASKPEKKKLVAKKPSPAVPNKIDNRRQPELPLSPAPGVLATTDEMWKMVDLVVDLPAGEVPAALLASAGFPQGATAQKGKDRCFMVNIPRQPGDLTTTIGHVKHINPEEMQKLIRDNYNGSRGAKPAAKKKGLDKARLAAEIREEIRKQIKRGSVKKKVNGKPAAREHLVVRYQGKELTLGHGPLGNYLVQALKPHYPDLRSAWVLKDNRIQLTFDGPENVGTGTMAAAEFEHKINNPPVPLVHQPQSALVEYRGTGAIAKLHELVDAMQPEDPPLEIPSVILQAAGFPAKTTAEIYAGEEELIIRVPKKPAQFLSVKQLEEKILDQARAAEPKPEEELVHA